MKCPICGEIGVELFSSFECTNTFCKNGSPAEAAITMPSQLETFIPDINIEQSEHGRFRVTGSLRRSKGKTFHIQPKSIPESRDTIPCGRCGEMVGLDSLYAFPPAFLLLGCETCFNRLATLIKGQMACNALLYRALYNADPPWTTNAGT
jgi:hypothetical protein